MTDTQEALATLAVKTADSYYVKGSDGHLIFFHDFCGGRFLADAEFSGANKCTTCNKRVHPYDAHNKMVEGRLCNGRMKYLDTKVYENGKVGYVEPRTYERECTECHQREVYARHLLVAIFNEGVTEADARACITSFGLDVVVTQQDRRNDSVLAIVATLPSVVTQTVSQYIEKLESRSDIVRAASSMLIPDSKQ